MENLKIYDAVRGVPAEARKPILAGRLKGKTDINPMWRIKTLTEQFGPVGIGWYYEIKEKRLEQGGNGEVAAFIDIDLYVKVDGEWSKPIVGTGGNSFVTNERNGAYTNDECFKMALTDAISVACKALGVGADVYWDTDAIRREPAGGSNPQQNKQQAIEADILEKVKQCATVPDLEEFFKRHKSSFANQNALIQACANRKSEINGAL